MEILMYSTRSYDKLSFRKELDKIKYDGIHIDFVETQLNEQTVSMAAGYDAICTFVNDKVNREVIRHLDMHNIKLILARCVGTNNIDLEACKEFGIVVKNVPAYSPESVAEHAAALLMTVNRHTHKAYSRVRDNNFSLSGLSGYCLNGKTVGIVGYGRIGQAFAKICLGLGMNVMVYDPMFNDPCNIGNIKAVDLDTLYKESDVISLHVPLLDSTRHMINDESIAKMKKDVILINVSRGGLIDNEALIRGIKDKKFFGVGLDVYEGEDDNAFTNHEDDILMNCITSRLTSFPNVVVTSHQAFLTDVALEQIAKTTLENAIK